MLWRVPLRWYSAAFDLRFDSKEDEAAYAKSLEDELLRMHCIGSGSGTVCIVLRSIWVFWREAAREDDPFSACLDDPRTLWFLALSLIGVYAALTCLCALARIYRNWFRSWRWETVVLASWTSAIIACILLNKWYWPLLFGRDPDTFWMGELGSARGDWVEVVLVIDVGVSMICRSIPIRVFQLGLMPLCCIGSMVLLDFVLGPALYTMRLSNMVFSIVLSTLALLGARQHEHYTRKEWRASQQIKKAEEIMGRQSRLIEEQHLEIREFEHGCLGDLPGTVGSSIMELMADDVSNAGAEFRAVAQPQMQQPRQCQQRSLEARGGLHQGAARVQQARLRLAGGGRSVRRELGGQRGGPRRLRVARALPHQRQPGCLRGWQGELACSEEWQRLL